MSDDVGCGCSTVPGWIDSACFDIISVIARSEHAFHSCWDFLYSPSSTRFMHRSLQASLASHDVAKQNQKMCDSSQELDHKAVEIGF
jgi:hypothetical protein